MSKRESISRYNLIIKKLRKHPSSFSEISDYLAFESDLQEYNFNVSKRTFQRDIEDIRSVYNIDIQYDFSRKVYNIESRAEFYYKSKNSPRLYSEQLVEWIVKQAAKDPDFFVRTRRKAKRK